MTEVRRIGALMSVAAWGGALLLLAWAASVFLEKEYNPNTSPQSGESSTGQVRVLLQRNRAGHYVATGMINRQPVRLLLDTGATYVALDQQLASRLGVEAGPAQRVQTANGEVRGYRTLLKEVSIGEISLSTVPAIIIPGLGEDVLLGMSFLKRLTLVQQGNTLLLETR